jgi:hypothetical protein
VAVFAAPGIANAAPPPGGGTGGSGGGDPTGGGTGGTGAGGTTVHKNVLQLPGLKIEIKTVQGQLPKIKFVPFPGLNQKAPPPAFACTGHGPVDLNAHPECGSSGGGGTG